MALTTYHTRSGSVYEFDEARKLVRRPMRGPPSRSDRPGEGDWRPYQDVEVTPGGQLWIIWGWVDGELRTTLTSPVVEPAGVPQ